MLTKGLLPCATYPQPDELLSSWLVRLAHDHLTKAHTFGQLVFAGGILWNRDMDRLAPKEVLTTLAERTPASPQQVYETTMLSYIGKLFTHHNPYGNTSWILPLGILHRTRRLNGTLFCPKCLRMDGNTPYFRKQWRLALSIVCPTCGVQLEEKCPQCQAPVAFFRAEIGRKSVLPDRPLTVCHQCDFDWREIPAKQASLALVNWQRECHRILREGWRSEVFYPWLYFKVLHHFVRLLYSSTPRVLALQQLVTEQSGVERTGSYGSIVRGRYSFESLPMDLRGVLLQQATWLLEDWPHRFITLGRECKLTSTPLLHDIKNVPFWYEYVVMDNFYVSNLNRRFEPLT